MNNVTATTNTIVLSYPDNVNTAGSAHLNLGLIPVVLFILIALCYGCYIFYKRDEPANNNNQVEESNNSTTALSRGLDDDILVTFPTFVYSDAAITELGFNNANSSSCYICLADYKGTDVIKLLPECGHLFHVRCIDTWLKVHPTCPVCRKSPSSLV